MPRKSAVISMIALLVLSDGLCAEDYLNKDGQLTKPLKVVQLQGGFAGFTGKQFKIAPDGTWTAESTFNDKITPKNKGKLTAKELARLGSLLEKYDLAKLPVSSGKPPGANPHTITLEFGHRKAALVGQAPPTLDQKNPAGSIESRFAGIWEAVVGLLTPATAP